MIVPLQADLANDHYSVEDWLDLPEIAGHRVELIDGSFVVSAMLSLNHQLGAGRLSTFLSAAAPLDIEAVGAVGVRTANEVAVPDVIVADTAVLLSGAQVLLPGQPHLVAEIVTPGSRIRDYRDKPRIYAEARIPNFLRVELVETAPPYVEVFGLGDGGYTLVAKASAGETLELTEPFPVSFDPGRLIGPRA